MSGQRLRLRGECSYLRPITIEQDPPPYVSNKGGGRNLVSLVIETTRARLAYISTSADSR